MCFLIYCIFAIIHHTRLHVVPNIFLEVEMETDAFNLHQDAKHYKNIVLIAISVISFSSELSLRTMLNFVNKSFRVVL